MPYDHEKFKFMDQPLHNLTYVNATHQGIFHILHETQTNPFAGALCVSPVRLNPTILAAPSLQFALQRRQDLHAPGADGLVLIQR
jgi:hypothetical protein